MPHKISSNQFKKRTDKANASVAGLGDFETLFAASTATLRGDQFAPEFG